MKKNMTKKIWFIIIVVVAVAGVFLDLKLNTVKIEKDFTLKYLNGETFTLSQYAGRPIILSFILSRCPDCKKEAAVLNRAYNQLKKEKNLTVIGIAEDDEVNDLVKNLEIVFPVVRDEQYRVAQLYGVKKLPHLVFINKKGEVVRSVIENVLDETTLDEYIHEII